MINRQKSVIARYENLVFSCFYLHTMDQWMLQFLDFFEGSDDDFFQFYKSQFPEHRLQIYKHKTKPLTRAIKDEILIIIKEPLMQKNIRDYNLSKLL